MPPSWTILIAQARTRCLSSFRIGSPLRRFPSTCPAPGCVPLRDQKFRSFPSSRTREWLREAQLHPSLVRSWHVPLCSHPRLPLDSQSHPIQPPYIGPTKGNIWRCFVFPYRDHCTFLAPTRQALPPPSFLLYSVGVLVCESFETSSLTSRRG